MATIQDTFTDTNGTDLLSHTGDSGVTWARHPSATYGQKIINNRAYGESGASKYLSSQSPATSSFDITSTWRFLTDAGYPSIGWYQDASISNGYDLRWASNADSWELRKHVSGTVTTLDSFAQTPTAGTDYTVTIEVRGDTFTCYVDGVEVCSATDTAISPGGTITIGSFGGSSTTSFHIDDILVEDVTVNTAPTVDAGADATITAGDTLTRTVSFVDPDADTWSATADYGEGAGVVAATVDQGAKTVALSNLYETAGAYTVTVVVSDGTDTGQDTFAVTVNAAPVTGEYIVADVTGTDASAPVVTLS